MARPMTASPKSLSRSPRNQMERPTLFWPKGQRRSVGRRGSIMKAPSIRPIRCAIYTRVSTEYGLDQEFNSLDAQYDAASAYIKSQAHAGWTLIRSRYDDGGWTLIRSRYDDGGYSGGSIDRLDLQRLLDDIGSRTLDVIVVYKVACPAASASSGSAIRRLNGADSSRRLDSIWNSRSTGPKVPNCGSAKPGIRLQLRSDFALNHGRRERNLLMQRQRAKNRRQSGRAPTETKIREMSGRKSPQKRAIRRRAGNVRFAETGWWCAQSDTNRSPTCNSLLTKGKIPITGKNTAVDCRL